MSAFKYQWNQTIDVGTAGLLSKQWTSIRHILSLLVTANACVHVTAYVAVRRSLSTTYTAVVLGLLPRQYVSYQFGVWAAYTCLPSSSSIGVVHDDVIKWRHFLRYWPFVRGIHRSPVNSPGKGQWRGALIFSLIFAWINGWVNTREAGDLRRHRVHYDVIVMRCVQ